MAAVEGEPYDVAPAPEAEIAAGQLHGTLTLPTGGPPAAVVLIIPGSGPTDRDGNSPLGVGAATYRLLAAGLAASGIASVRIDKRGMYASAGACADANDVTLAAYAADVRAWISAIQTQTGHNLIWLVGHSEGGLVAIRAAETEHCIAGLALLAVPGRKLGDVLRDQVSANPANAPFLAEIEGAIRSLEAGRRVDPRTLSPPLRGFLRAEIQGFLIDVLAYDPAAALARFSGPVLVLHGDEDLQVGAADRDALARARPDARVISLPGVNHVLKAAPTGDRAANVAAYAESDRPLAPGVVETLVRFILGACPP